MASNIGNIGKVPELRKRILFTLALLAVYRVGVFVTIPGVNRVEMARPAASSRALLMRLPVERRWNERESWVVELVRLRCALSEATFVLMNKPIFVSP